MLRKKLVQVAKESTYIRQGVPELKRLAKPAVFWLIICEVILVMQVYPTKFMVDGLTSRRVPSLIVWAFGTSVSAYLFALAVGVLGIYLLGVYGHKRKSVAQNAFGVMMSNLLWAETHHKQLNMSADWHIKHGTGEKESLLAKNTERVSRLLNDGLWQATPTILRIIMTTLVMTVFGWTYTSLALVTLVAYTLINLHIEPHIRPMREEYLGELRALDRFGSELTRNWRAIRGFGLEDWFSQRNRDLLQSFWKGEVVRHAAWRSYVDLPDYMLACSRFVLYVVSIRYGLANPNAIGSVVLAIMLMERVYSNYYRLGDFQRQLHEGLAAFDELSDVLVTKPSVQQPSNPIWPEKIRGAVEFRGVGFTYDGGAAAVKDLNLVVKPGQIVAFIGRTGSGKTTLLSLLQMEHHPTKGAIYVDGVDLRRIDCKRYRRELIGVVHQHSLLFDTTVAQNASVSTQFRSNQAEIEMAANQAYAGEFIDRLPLKYQTPIGEDGISLSGGQRQRLAISRALIRRPRILILDEPTSALDPDSQMQVQRAIDELIARRESTIFVIAHRFSTIESADLVVVMEEGRIAEVGTHEELARKNGVYRHYRDLEMRGALV